MSSKPEYTVEQIRKFVTTNPAWAEKAIVRLYEQQTPQEQEVAVTAYKNGRGFNGVDAEILTSFAKQILREQNFVQSKLDPRTNKFRVYSWGSKLSSKQLALAYKRLGKYAAQLYRLAYGDKPVSEPSAVVEEPAKSEDVLPGETVLVDGRDYWLGATTGTYDRQNDCFILGNCWVDRFETIYAKSPVSEMSVNRI